MDVLVELERVIRPRDGGLQVADHGVDASEFRAFNALTPRAHHDGLKCFAATIVQAASHTPIVVGSGRQSVERAEFRCVNTVISNLKTAISGTYHAFKFDKYIHRYLAEVQYRFNRRYDLKAILARLLRAAVLTGPRPERVISAAELGG